MKSLPRDAVRKALTTSHCHATSESGTLEATGIVVTHGNGDEVLVPTAAYTAEQFLRDIAATCGASPVIMATLTPRSCSESTTSWDSSGT